VSDFSTAQEALLRYFGFSDFREGQAEVVETILSGQNAVVVMPTGGGKSLCYQLPAMMMDGVTLVVSPLIALMKDQVDQLTARGLPSTFINSSINYREVTERLSAIRRGRFKLVYIAPERFRSEAFVQVMSEVGVKLFAVDEAHCISHWGHDFRPDYLRLKQATAQLGDPQIIALTATATAQVRADIVEQLGLIDPRVFVAGFDRPNLNLSVVPVKTEKEKLAIIKRIVTNATGSGIIYTSTRKSVEQLAARLKMTDMMADAYHGGMEEGERTRAQEKFMSGESKAIVATNAFGMGIDKSDIRFVIHYHIPGSIEAYYQEVGRAGRDGLPSDCLLLFNYADTRTQQFFIEGSHPPVDLIEKVYDEIASIGSERVELTAREIAARIGIKNDMSIYSALVILEKAGHIERGRPSDSDLMCRAKTAVHKALESVSDESSEGAVLRDLIFNRNISERESTEIVIEQIGSTLGMADAQVRRALAQLAERGLIEYRNTYQGRGIKMLDREPARALRIDQKELAARAAAEQWKLRRMVDYCYYRSCLRQFILKYFGDRKLLSACGTCSNCATHVLRRTSDTSNDQVAAGTLGVAQTSKLPEATPLDQFIIDQAPTGEELRDQLRRRALASRAASPQNEEASGSKARSLSQEEVIIVQKILSCVARLRNRFGKGTVAAVLRGSASKQIRENNLDTLSTYGLLRNMTQDMIAAYIKGLIDAQCIGVSQGAYPTVSLTEFGREVMLGRAETKLDLPD
jgi:ATP-dependent DNA helicase RecQ